MVHQCCEACSDDDIWCRDANNQVIRGLRPGNRLQQECLVCFCGPSGNAHCGKLQCPRPKCSKPVIPEGGCCRRCLTGKKQGGIL
ncbi:hypothetical protein ACOMHN_032666 [Nucella lapillus]